MRPTVAERLGWTFDDGSYTRIELPKVPVDPLRFRDSKRYTDRLKDAREKTQLEDAIVVAHGTIGGHRAVVAVHGIRLHRRLDGRRGRRRHSSPRPGSRCCRKRR